jgi:hypothetical protein
MDDQSILSRIDGLVDEEHTLLGREEADAVDPDALEADQQRLQQVTIELDRCWDLLRQRRARRDAGQDPDAARCATPPSLRNTCSRPAERSRAQSLGMPGLSGPHRRGEEPG